MIDSVGAGQTIPLSSQIVQKAGEEAEKNVVTGQKGETLATPENVNKVADKADEKALSIQEQQAQEQAAKRGVAVGVSAAQHQQDMMEIYLEQSTDTEIENNDPNFSEAMELAEQAKQAETLENLSYKTEQQKSLLGAYTGLTAPKEESIFHIMA